MKRIFAVLFCAIFLVLCFSACTTSGHVAFASIETSGNDFWNWHYEKLNGNGSHSIRMPEGDEFVFVVDVETNEGTLDLRIEDSEGNELYSGSALPTASFEVGADAAGEYTIFFDAEDHNGGFSVSCA